MHDSKKKNLLVVTDYFYPHWTGFSKSMCNMTRFLKGEFDITVLTVRYEKNLKLWERIFSVNIVRKPYIFTLSRSKYSISIIFEFFSIVNNYDVIFINSPCSNILFFAILTKLFKKKLLVFHQGDIVLPKSFANRLIEKIFDILSIISFSIADKVSTYTTDYAKNSRVLKPFLFKFSPLLMPIYLPGSTRLTRTLRKVRAFKEKGNILFGFAGRFVEEKGFDILFDAIPLIIRELPNVHFVFAGAIQMGYEDFFQKNKNKFEKVKDFVTILGLLDDSELAGFYKLIDFILVSSRSDCFPLVQAEAMFLGKPSIVSNIPGARALVKETGFGLIFEKENPADLARAILKAVENREMLLKNYRKVVHILNTTKNVKKIREFIEN